jgi:hypothetical protein
VKPSDVNERIEEALARIALIDMMCIKVCSAQAKQYLPAKFGPGRRKSSAQ